MAYIEKLAVYSRQKLSPEKEASNLKLFAIQNIIRYAAGMENGKPYWSKYLPQRNGNLITYDKHYLASLDAADGSPVIWFVFSLCNSPELGAAMMLHAWMQSLLGLAMRDGAGTGEVAAFALSFLCAEIAPRLLDPVVVAPLKCVYMQSLEGTDRVVASMKNYWKNSNPDFKNVGPFMVAARDSGKDSDGPFIYINPKDNKTWVDKLIVDKWVADYWKQFTTESREAESKKPRIGAFICSSCFINHPAFAPNGNPELGFFCGEHCYYHQ
jgi:hypothetical protein